jgi:hypothetical protein
MYAYIEYNLDMECGSRKAMQPAVHTNRFYMTHMTPMIYFKIHEKYNLL